MAKKTITLNQDYPYLKINIPNKALDELEKILPDDETSAEIYLISNKALIKVGDTSFITRLIEGAYPDTSALFPKEKLTSLSFNASPNGEFKNCEISINEEDQFLKAMHLHCIIPILLCAQWAMWIFLSIQMILKKPLFLL